MGKQESQRKWRKNHPHYSRDFMRTYRKNPKNRKRMLLHDRECMQRKRRKIVKLIGNRCAVCGEIKMIKDLEFHEIYGKEHPRGSRAWNYILNHPDDFVPLCKSLCHLGVHFMMKIGFTWNEILVLSKKKTKFEN